jgi:phosphomannomutase / phosphoglucomutase
MNQNIFREYDIRGIVGEDLTEETVYILARALSAFFNKNGAKRIADLTRAKARPFLRKF